MKYLYHIPKGTSVAAYRLPETTNWYWTGLVHRSIITDVDVTYTEGDAYTIADRSTITNWMDEHHSWLYYSFKIPRTYGIDVIVVYRDKVRIEKIQ